jgi:glutamine amidotransferase
MHNGGVGAFTQIRRGMLNEMSQYAAENMKGTTDSEHLAYLTFTYLAQRVDRHGLGLLEGICDLLDVKAALEKAIAKVIELQHQYLESLSAQGNTVPAFQPSSLNVAITDGKQLLAIRFRNNAEQTPPSLYYSTEAGARFNRRFADLPGAPATDGLKTSEEHGSHVIIASEPLTKEEADLKMWHEVEKNQCLMVDAHMRLSKAPVDVKF